jgi:hypothetical protein
LLHDAQRIKFIHRRERLLRFVRLLRLLRLPRDLRLPPPCGGPAGVDEFADTFAGPVLFVELVRTLFEAAGVPLFEATGVPLFEAAGAELPILYYHSNIL